MNLFSIIILPFFLFNIEYTSNEIETDRNKEQRTNQSCRLPLLKYLSPTVLFLLNFNVSLSGASSLYSHPMLLFSRPPPYSLTIRLSRWQPPWPSSPAWAWSPWPPWPAWAWPWWPSSSWAFPPLLPRPARATPLQAPKTERTRPRPTL